MGVIVHVPARRHHDYPPDSFIVRRRQVSIGWSTSPSYTIPHYPSLKKASLGLAETVYGLHWSVLASALRLLSSLPFSL